MREGGRERVVSLVAVGCDILLALGASHLLVGHAHAPCDAQEIRGMEVCTESITGEMECGSDCEAAKLAMEALLWEAVLGRMGTTSSLIEWALAPHRVLLQKLRDLKPDIIITELRASELVSSANVQASLEAFLGKKVTILTIDTKRLGGVWEVMAKVAQELGLKSERVLEATQDRVFMVRNMCRGRVKKQILCLQWDTNGLLPHVSTTMGTWVQDVIHLVGGIDVSFKARSTNLNIYIGPSIEEGNPYTHFVSMDSIFALSADIIIFTNPKWDLNQMHHELSTHKRQFKLLLHKFSMPTIHLVVAHGPSFLSRPSPSLLVNSMEALCEILHPECQPFGHEGILWRSMDLSEE